MRTLKTLTRDQGADAALVDGTVIESMFVPSTLGLVG